ncbi:MAG TPA: four helix bundle protein [Bacteroidota bacterium]
MSKLLRRSPYGKITSEAQSPKSKVYDLEERTAQFGERIIKFAKELENGEINRVLVSQIVRSATSIGANDMEADGAESKKDFQHKIALSKKEAKETKHWLRMIATANSSQKDQCRSLFKEAQELTLIFSSILISAKKNSKVT